MYSVLTTEIRATGHSAANAIARIAGAVCPYVVSSHNSFTTIGIVTLCCSVVTGYAAWNLPETIGKTMGSVTELHGLTRHSQTEDEGATLVTGMSKNQPSPPASNGEVI